MGIGFAILWIVAAAVLAVMAIWGAGLVRQWRVLEKLVGDLEVGTRPASPVFFRSKPLARLATRLEKISRDNYVLRKKSEEARFNSETILTSMAEGVMVVNREHTVRLVNDSFRELFALKNDPVDQSVLSALRDASIDRLIGTALESGDRQTSELTTTTLRGPGGAVRHLTASAVPLRDTNGTVTGAVTVFHDITRLRQLEEIRRDFVANVSHELRTPLSIFQGYLETVLDDPTMPRKEVAANLAIMKKHSLRLNALLEDLLTLARLESRSEELDRATIEIPLFLEQLAHDWRPRLVEKKIAFYLEAEPDLPRLLADPWRLEQVCNNLIANAIKFTDEDGLITIHVIAEGTDVVFRFRDNGIGIPPGDLPHIFERFYRVEKGRSRAAGGTGLGLSIVKHIAALHGGSVSAESEFGKGTTMTVRLPIGLAIKPESGPSLADPAPQD